MVISCSNLGGIFPKMSEDHLDAKLNFQFQNPGLSGLICWFNCSEDVLPTASVVKKLKSSTWDFLSSFHLKVVPSLNPNLFVLQAEVRRGVCFIVRGNFLT